MRKIKHQNIFVFSPSFYVKMTPVRKHVLSFKHVLCIFGFLCARLRFEEKKRDSNITLVNRRLLGKSYTHIYIYIIYIYIYIYLYIVDDASQGQHPLDFDLTPGQAFADQLH